MTNRRGQTTLILILVAAAALILFAIVLNWGRVAQVKTLTQTAATTGASLLSSDFSSYAESVLQTTLGGQWKICKSTSIFEAIITLVIAIVALILAPELAPAVAATATILAVVSVTLAVANLALQVLVVQPGLTKLWNSMQKNLSMSDQFMEQALQNSLMGAVNDPVLITDYFDENVDGHFGSSNGTTPDDVISRFGFFYTERLKGIAKPDTVDITRFQNETSKFITGSPGSGYALPLTVSCSNPADPHCNPCCVSVTAQSKAVRPATCSQTSSDAPPPAECTNTSVWKYASQYPLVYDPTYPDYYNVTNTSSFLAQFGLDAEVRDSSGVSGGVYNKDDVLPVDNTVNPPARSGIYAFAWDNHNLLTDPNRAPGSNDPANALLVNCGNAPPPAGCDTRTSDAVTQTPQFMDVPEGQCPDSIDPMSNLPWKDGADMYCSTDWPYDQCGTSCPPLNLNDPNPPNPDTSGCGCTPGTAPQHHDDPLDDVVYGLKQFYVWAEGAAAMDPVSLVNSMQQWYPQAAFWLGPPCDGGNAGVCYCDGPDATCMQDGGADAEHNGGMLYRYSARLGYWQSLINAWVLANSYTGAQAWCMPPMAGPNPPPGISAAEAAAITANGAVAWGSLQSVINCLDYNASPLGDTDAGGNGISDYGRFQKCALDLSASCPGGVPATCTNLPRSLVAGAAPAPSCDTSVTPNFTTWVQGSAVLAGAQGSGLQGDRFRARSLMLKHMLDEAQKVSAAMATYKGEIDTYLASPGLAALYRSAAGGGPTNGLSNTVMYGWRDQNPPANGSRAVGYWHIVRVTGAMPGRCQGYSCLTDRLAWVRTYTKGFLGLTRCYELTDYTGNSRMVVTRWDEDHDPLFFANRMPLWQVLFHPSGTVQNSGSLEADCGGKFIGLTSSMLGMASPTLPNVSMFDNHTLTSIKDAFMFGAGPTGGNDTACYNLASGLLNASGVTTQVCAQYTLNAGKSHMLVKFIPCQ